MPTEKNENDRSQPTLDLSPLVRQLVKSELRPLDEIVRAHDLLVGILFVEFLAPNALLHLTRRDLDTAASVLCWCLKHDDNKRFAADLVRLETEMRAAGFELCEAKAAEGGS